MNSNIYFYALFTDDDVNYLRFNRDCLYSFIELVKNDFTVNKTKLNKLVKIIKIFIKMKIM